MKKIALSLLFVLLYSGSVHAELMAIVHKMNKATSISKSDFIEFFTGEKTSWDEESAVVLGMMDIETKSGKTFFKSYMTEMDEKKFIDHWLNLELFGQGIAPLNFKEVSKLYTFISKYKKNALGYIEESEAKNLPDTLKLIKIK